MRGFYVTDPKVPKYCKFAGVPQFFDGGLQSAPPWSLHTGHRDAVAEIWVSNHSADVWL